MKQPPPHHRMFYCKAEKEQNNGLVKHCGFTGYFENRPGFAYNCPTCNSILVLPPAGPSVSELLQKGMREEKDRPGYSKE